MDLKEKIAKVLSECLSDQLECKVTIKFVPQAAEKQSA